MNSDIKRYCKDDVEITLWQHLSDEERYRRLYMHEAFSEHRYIIDAAIFRFINCEIGEHQFRTVLVNHGYNAADAEAEIAQHRPNRAPYVFQGQSR